MRTLQEFGNLASLTSSIKPGPKKTSMARLWTITCVSGGKGTICLSFPTGGEEEPQPSQNRDDTDVETRRKQEIKY